MECQKSEGILVKANIVEADGNLQWGSKVRPVALFYTVKDPFGG